MPRGRRLEESDWRVPEGVSEDGLVLVVSGGPRVHLPLVARHEE